MNTIDAIREEVVAGHPQEVERLLTQALEQDLPAESILREGLIAAMAIVGRKFECGEIFVPEMLVSARTMKQALSVLKPRLQADKVEPIGRVVIGTVQGDLHDIGKNLVTIMLEGAGFEVVDLGANVSPDRFVAAVREHRPDFVGMSALLTTTMPSMRATLNALREAGLRDAVQVMVGGAPVTAEFAEQIAADLFAPDASAAAHKARDHMAQRAPAPG